MLGFGRSWRRPERIVQMVQPLQPSGIGERNDRRKSPNDRSVPPIAPIISEGRKTPGEHLPWRAEEEIL